MDKKSTQTFPEQQKNMDKKCTIHFVTPKCIHISVSPILSKRTKLELVKKYKKNLKPTTQGQILPNEKLKNTNKAQGSAVLKQRNAAH